jgi:hypothetical protein
MNSTHVKFSKEDSAPCIYLYLLLLHRDAFTTPDWLIMAEERHFLFLIYLFRNALFFAYCLLKYASEELCRTEVRQKGAALFFIYG